MSTTTVTTVTTTTFDQQKADREMAKRLNAMSYYEEAVQNSKKNLYKQWSQAWKALEKEK